MDNDWIIKNILEPGMGIRWALDEARNQGRREREKELRKEMDLQMKPFENEGVIGPCKDCRYWHDIDAGEMGQCRRWPPIMSDQWNKTLPTEWCGEFKEKTHKVQGDFVIATAVIGCPVYGIPSEKKKCPT